MVKRFFSRTVFVLIMTVLPLAVSAASQAGKTAIKAGNILHCFDWKFTDIQAELSSIQAAGFNTIQTSVAQKNYGGQQNWNDIYRPWDTQIGNGLGTQAQLTALCAAAHALNMYIIVDVVANHTDGQGDPVAPYGGMDAFWKNTDLYHSGYGWANDGSRFQATHGHIGMPDLKTEDSRVQQKFAAYVQLLKSCGVDGIRWDAAKHIGLPSEGDNFWTVVLDQDMYNYGEILNTTGGDHNACINEYQSLGLAVTDNNYSTRMCLGAFQGGGVPSGNESWRGGSSHKDMFVYWGESHDTYLNAGDASEYTDQNVVDRAYAIAAAHENIPGLYLSRPSKPAKVGIKGSTHYMDSEVAEVNKMKNACAGEAEYYVNNNGVGAILRNSGAVIVKGSGSGQINIPNGGSTLAPGTYEDHVSGGTFTVTSSTISGSVGNKGIAVLYSGGSTPMPRASITPNGGTFTTETLSVTVTGSNCTSVWYRIGTAAQQTISGTTATFTIGQGVAFGTAISVSYGCSDSDGNQSAMATATFTKKDPNAVSKIYLKNAAHWSAAYIYVYTESPSASNYAWPGVQMSAVSGDACYDYEYSLPEGFENGCRIIFAESSSSSNRYPADRQPGMIYTGGDMLFNNAGNAWAVFDHSDCGGSQTDGGLCLKSAGEISVWFELPAGWTLDAVNVFGWGNGCSELGDHPGKPMTKVADGLFKYTFSAGVAPQMIQFNNTNVNPWYQMQCAFTPNGVYTASSATTNGATLRETVTEVCGGVPSDVENVVSREKEAYGAQKLLLNGVLYIRIGEQLYDALGRVVR